MDRRFTPDAFHRATNIHMPTLTVYAPAKPAANQTAVIIAAPGRGHRYLVVDLEGESVAKKLNAMRVAAFVLRNRLAYAERSTYQVENESLADLQQAIRAVRDHAREHGIAPDRDGVMGMSAGEQTRHSKLAGSAASMDGRFGIAECFNEIGAPTLCQRACFLDSQVIAIR